MLKLGSLVRPALSESYWNDVVLLLKMEGTNGGTTFTDSSKYGKTITRIGGSITSSAQYKFGSTSCSLDGSGDGLSAPITSGLGSGDFTVELWIRPSSVSVDRVLFWGDYSYMLLIQEGSLYWVHDSNTECQIDSVPVNSWSHVAVTRSSGVIRTFLNGTVSSTTVTSTTNLSYATWYIGIDRDGYGGVSGYIDELRVVKQRALYTASFTPPTEEFPTG